jgi:hypothetical protein
MDQHQKGAKGGREQLPNGMPIPRHPSLPALAPDKSPLNLLSFSLISAELGAEEGVFVQSARVTMHGPVSAIS